MSTWQETARSQGWQVLTKKRDDMEWWFGLVGRSGVSGYAGATTEVELLEKLEGWWDEYNSLD